MKNTNRVRRKRGIKPASTQVKTTAGSTSNLAELIDDTPTLVLFKSGSSIAQVFLTPAQFEQLEARVSSVRELNISLTDMLERALAKMLVTDDGFLELEQAKNQALTLMELLCQSMLSEISSQRWENQLGAGLDDLVHAATARLEHAFNSAEAAAQGKLEEVAS